MHAPDDQLEDSAPTSDESQKQEPSQENEHPRSRAARRRYRRSLRHAAKRKRQPVTATAKVKEHRQFATSASTDNLPGGMVSKTQAGKGERAIPPTESGNSLPGGPSLLGDPRHLRGDIQLIGSAAKRRWEIDPKVKQAFLTQIARVALTSDDARVLIRAGNFYLGAERQNQIDEHKLLPDMTLHAHMNVRARESVADLSLEELRIMRRLHQRMRDSSVDVASSPVGGNGNGHAGSNGNGNGKS
jgi:hypothetical protein